MEYTEILSCVYDNDEAKFASLLESYNSVKSTLVIVDEIMRSKIYKFIFHVPLNKIQQYFDSDIPSSEAISLLLQLCPGIDITPCLHKAYNTQNSKLFRILCAYINHDYIVAHQNLIGELAKNVVHPSYISYLIKHGISDSRTEFLNAVNNNNVELINQLFSVVDSGVVFDAFKIAYAKGDYNIAERMYSYMSIYRIANYAIDLGYCASAEILRLCKFQEFYIWENQLMKAIELGDFYNAETLLDIMPNTLIIPYAIIELMLPRAPECLLKFVCEKFVVLGLTAEVAKSSMRQSLIDHVKIVKSNAAGWEVL